MAISLFKIKKWTNMILGRSSYHVNQTEGKCYSVNQIKGYYNNLTEKITRFQVPGNEIPITHHDNGTVEYFSIAIFQYGLAAYDLWILNNDKSNLEKFKNCVDWAMENQENSGAWKPLINKIPNTHIQPWHKVKAFLYLLEHMSCIRMNHICMLQNELLIFY